MTPEELKLKVEELRASITEKLVELEEDPNWGGADEREELALAIDEVIVQAQAIRDVLQDV